jgi:hypothetical protein
VIEQGPNARIVTVLPATVQTPGVVEAKVTVRPELAVATIENGPTSRPTLFSGPKVMLCAPWATVKLRVTGAAAA